MVSNTLEVLYNNQELDTPRLLLRKFRKDDAEGVYAYASDPEAVRFLIWDGVKTLEEARQSIFQYSMSRPGIYAMELKETGGMIGAIDLRLEEEHEKAGFGYVLARPYWGRGLMTEALTALIALCFEKLELNRVEAVHYVGNEGSGRVMQKCGMAREGVGIQEVKVKGVFRDVVHYGMTREAWAAVR